MLKHVLSGTYTIVVDGLVAQVSIEDLKQRTIDLHAAMRRNQESADRAFASWGDLLRQVKDQVGHGHWGALLRACDVGERTAQRAMRISTLCIVNGRFDVTLAHAVLEAERQGRRAVSPNEDRNPQHVTDLPRPGHAGTHRDTLAANPNGIGNPSTVTDLRGSPARDTSMDEDEELQLISEETIASFATEEERRQMREANDEIRRRLQAKASPAAKGTALLEDSQDSGTVKAPEPRNPRPEPRPVQMDMSVLYEAAERVRAAMTRAIERIRSGGVSVEKALEFAAAVERF